MRLGALTPHRQGVRTQWCLDADPSSACFATQRQQAKILDHLNPYDLAAPAAPDADWLSSQLRRWLARMGWRAARCTSMRLVCLRHVCAGVLVRCATRSSRSVPDGAPAPVCIGSAVW